LRGLPTPRWTGWRTWSRSAAKVNKALCATELLIVGNPQGGTPLMEWAPTAGTEST